MLLKEYIQSFIDILSGFGATGGAVTGTTVKYEPVTGTDTMTRNGVSTNIRTRIEVISTMKVSGLCFIYG